ncbi:MAG: peroxiredoxin [Microthrixaceae bacterium]
MLTKGDRAPEFTLKDQNGDETTLSAMLVNGPVVVFFYPRAMTSGCTRESCHFRDLKADFDSVGAQPVGISADSVDRQSKFDATNSLGFTLLSDPDRKVAGLFGVRRPGPLFNKRATFVIGSDGTVLANFSSEMNMEAHADRALEVLRGEV